MLKRILLLGGPIIVGQLGLIAQQFADTMMVGHYATSHLAASGFINNLFNLVIFSLLGISYAVTPVVGAARGMNDSRAVAQSLVDGIVANLAAGSIVTVVLLGIHHNIGIFGQPPEIIPIALPYLLILSASVPFMAVFNALKQYSDALGDTSTPMWIMLASNVLNVIFNFLLIFGLDTTFMSVPPLGLTGAGIATLISRIFALTALALCIKRPHGFTLVNMRGIKHMFQLGIPISIQLTLEASSFNICAVFMGWLGAIPLAAHQIMCTIATLCFQVVYGIGAAASVIISQYRGAGDWENVRRTAHTAWVAGFALIMGMNALVFMFHNPLIGAFTDNGQVRACILSLMPCFFLYQIGDSIQIVYANALRGIEQVRRMMAYAFVSYLIVSIPLSYTFGFVIGLGSTGVWLGIPFGLSLAGLLFWHEFRRQTRQKTTTPHPG